MTGRAGSPGGPSSPPPEAESAAPARRALTPEAQRALAEAQERRRAIDEAAAKAPREVDGRGGLDPVRYGDWEIKGLTSDF